MDPKKDLETPLLGNRVDAGDDGMPENAEHKALAFPASPGEWGLDLEAAGNSTIKLDGVHEREPPPFKLDSNQTGDGRLNFGDYLSKDKLREEHGSTPGAREYYRRQREAIAGFQEVDATVASAQEPVEDVKKKNRETFAINISNMCNVLLLIVKVFASVESHSLAIMASTLDSLLDLLAGLVLWLTRIAMRDKDPYKYPVGKLRVQPVGIIVFACIMATLGLQVLLTGVKELLEQDGAAAHMGHMERIYVTVVMSTAIILKLALFLYCRTFDNEIVAAYAQDHYFDIITNLVGLAAALIASRYLWWLDPVGAIILALYTITVWSKTVLENAVSLVGKSASPELLQKVTYMALRHDPQINKIRTVRAYTVGTFFFVEVDLELADDLPLRDARQIAQSLQDKLEVLPEVERAFVHPYASFHRPDPVKAEPSTCLHRTAPAKPTPGLD